MADCVENLANVIARGSPTHWEAVRFALEDGSWGFHGLRLPGPVIVITPMKEVFRGTIDATSSALVSYASFRFDRERMRIVAGAPLVPNGTRVLDC